MRLLGDLMIQRCFQSELVSYKPPKEFQFFIGLHQPSDARHFDRCLISVNRIRERVAGFGAQDWIMDSGAFTEIFNYGHYRHKPIVYAKSIANWSWRVGRLLAAVTQDYMCEEFILKKTGMTVIQHQALTIKRYKLILQALKILNCPTYLMPVLQGYKPHEYVEHLNQYGSLLQRSGQWVGVGSVCKRNGNPDSVYEVLDRIKQRRPDLILHAFGIKLTCLRDPRIVALLGSSDSIAWSLAALYEGRNQNSWKEAKAYEEKVNNAVAVAHSVRMGKHGLGQHGLED